MFCGGPDGHSFRLCCPDVGGPTRLLLWHKTSHGQVVRKGGSVQRRRYPGLQAGAGPDVTQSPPSLLFCQMLLFSLSFLLDTWSEGPLAGNSCPKGLILWSSSHELKLGLLSPIRQMRKRRPAGRDDVAKVSRIPWLPVESAAQSGVRSGARGHGVCPPRPEQAGGPWKT